jgi:DNA-binding transcriptional LysR family regulator
MRGLLRINVSRASLPLLVNRLLPGFLDLHPNVQLELLGDGRMIDIVAEEFDAGIRLGHFVKVDMVAVGLTPAEPYAEVGAPQLFERLGRPDKPQDLHPAAPIDPAAGSLAIPGRFARGYSQCSGAADPP